MTGPLGNLVLWWGFPDIFKHFEGIQMMMLFPAPKNKATIFCGYLSSGSPGVACCGHSCVGWLKIHPRKLTWNLQITHLERKVIFQTSMRTCSMSVFWGVSFLNRNLGDLLCVPISVPVEALENLLGFL